MHTPTKDELDIALEHNDLEAILDIEDDLNHCLNATRTRYRLAFTPHAKEVAEHEEKYILWELQRCRAYRKRVDLILNEETNSLQVELAISKGMNLTLWVKQYGEKFRVLWESWVRRREMAYLLYKE